MSFWKKVGNFAKKALPIASAVLPFIPGVGTALSGVAGAASRFFTGGSQPSNAQAAAGGWNSGIGLDMESGDAVRAVPGPGGTYQLPGATVTAPRTPEPASSFDWAGALRGAAPALGAVAGGAATVYGQQQANAANAEQAQKQMDFQERMSNTQWQRGVKDMQAAGLNPMLAYSQGGASSPSGAQATMQNELSGGVSSALQGVTALQQLEATQAGIEQTRAMVEQTHEATAQIRRQGGLTNAQTESVQADVLQRLPADLREKAARTLGIQLDNQFLSKTMDPRVGRERYSTEILGYRRGAAYNDWKHQSKYEDYRVNVAPFVNDARGAADILTDFFPPARTVRHAR